jgi:hypothetical protein
VHLLALHALCRYGRVAPKREALKADLSLVESLTEGSIAAIAQW